MKDSDRLMTNCTSFSATVATGLPFVCSGKSRWMSSISRPATSGPGPHMYRLPPGSWEVRTNWQQPGIVTDAQGDLDPLIREHLRLSMVLMHSPQPSPELSRIETERPYPSPACFAGATTPLAGFQIHRYFLSSERGKLEVQQLVRNELLPNYNFSRAHSRSLLSSAGRYRW